MGYFRIANTFEVEYGHRLCKHPEKCRFPHGHSLRIEIVARARQLDGNDMVCDYKALSWLSVGFDTFVLNQQEYSSHHRHPSIHRQNLTGDERGLV